MGCWNQTCTLSQVPIFAGDPVRAMVVKRRDPYMNACGPSYPYEFWAPVGLVLSGEYDDYGMITGIDDTSPAARVLRDEFLTGGWQAEIKDLKIPKDATADAIIQCIDDASREHDRKTEWVYGVCLIAEPIFQAVTAAVRAVWRHEGEVGRFLAEVADLPELEPRDLFRLQHTMVPQYLRNVFHDNHAETSVWSVLFDDATGFEQALEDHWLLHLAMHWGRKVWVLQSGQGSQDDDMTIQSAVALATLAYAGAYKQKQAAEWGDEEDEDGDEAL